MEKWKKEKEKRNEINLTVHNFIMGLTNKSENENDVKEISRLLGQESLYIMTLFRLGKKFKAKQDRLR